MTFRNLSILQKISLVVVVTGEEVAREAMDLRVDIIAISRMTDHTVSG